MDKKGGALGLFGYSFSKREKKLLLVGERKKILVFSTIYSSTLDQGKCELNICAIIWIF
jgi:hypothetical protein